MSDRYQHPDRNRTGQRCRCCAREQKFFRTIQLRPIRFVMIASILRLISDPVTPDTQTSGDSV